ncbi:MAG TPA: CYTH and CHAD domain-containing protein [Amycolatopsis sp.]|nr:CYTH and CHAD domain-containing protein [Amycolatopsis sp.]
MTTVFRERERKFDLDPDRPVPRLEGAGPVARQCQPDRIVLTATYFDTADHRLLRSNVTLRKRTGGADAGWHLKVPVERDARDEVQLPLAASGTLVPPELAERVALDAGDLVEVAHIRTERDSYDLVDQADRRLATLTDDHVTADLPGEVVHLDSWRELEIELDAGAAGDLLDTLGDALTRAGARPSHWPSKLSRLMAEDRPARSDVGRRSTAGEVVLAYLRRQVDAVRQHDIGVRDDADDAVHQLRVAMRRLRSALTTFRRVLDRDRTKAVSDELRWAGGVLSDARDTEVLRDLFADDLSGPGGATLTHHFDQAEAQSRTAAVDLLNGYRYAALLGSLEDLIHEPPLTANADRPARKELRRAIKRAHRKLSKAVDGVDEGSVDEGLHEVRKKAKQARYAADTASPAFGSRLDSWRAAAKGIQTTLGDYHDLVEARVLLERLSRDDTAPAKAAFTFGRLYERARARGAALREQFTGQWQDVPQPR